MSFMREKMVLESQRLCFPAIPYSCPVTFLLFFSLINPGAHHVLNWAHGFHPSDGDSLILSIPQLFSPSLFFPYEQLSHHIKKTNSFSYPLPLILSFSTPPLASLNKASPLSSFVHFLTFGSLPLNGCQPSNVIIVTKRLKKTSTGRTGAVAQATEMVFFFFPTWCCCLRGSQLSKAVPDFLGGVLAVGSGH